MVVVAVVAVVDIISFVVNQLQRLVVVDLVFQGPDISLVCFSQKCSRLPVLFRLSIALNQTLLTVPVK